MAKKAKLKRKRWKRLRALLSDEKVQAAIAELAAAAGRGIAGRPPARSPASARATPPGSSSALTNRSVSASSCRASSNRAAQDGHVAK